VSELGRVWDLEGKELEVLETGRARLGSDGGGVRGGAQSEFSGGAAEAVDEGVIHMFVGQ
jgi:hypothetical protein